MATNDQGGLRSAQARIAALTRAAQTDGREISAPGRKAFLDSFQIGHECRLCKPVTIDQGLPPEQRARAVEALISAHFTRLALASALRRRRASSARAEASDADRELAAGLAQLDVG